MEKYYQSHYRQTQPTNTMKISIDNPNEACDVQNNTQNVFSPNSTLNAYFSKNKGGSMMSTTT